MKKKTYILLLALACASCSTPRISKEAFLDANPKLKYHRPAELWKHSELVVLARPTTSRNVGMEHSFKGCCVDYLRCECWETQFDIELVLKGDDKLTHLSLLHYQKKREENDTFLHGCLYGPSLAHFELPQPKKESDTGGFGGGFGATLDHRPSYLLFLKRYFTGDYVPVTGQEMSTWSVCEVYDAWTRPTWRKTQQSDAGYSEKAAEGDPFGTPDP